jgi:hypothetical protein
MNGEDLIKRGHSPGPHFKKVLAVLNQKTHTESEILDVLREFEPPPVMELQAPALVYTTSQPELMMKNPISPKYRKQWILCFVRPSSERL